MPVKSPTERPYESLFICPIETPQKTLDAFIEKIKTTLSGSQANVREVQVWGRRRLAYPIKHHKDGLYIYVDFNGGSQSAETLKNLYRVTDFVIRYMTVEREEAPPPRRSQITGEAGAAPGTAPAAPTTSAAVAPSSAVTPESAAKTPPSA